MIGFRAHFLTLFAILAVAACTSPVRQAPVVKAVAPVKKPLPKSKPVRMNGRGKVSSISLTEFFPLHESGKVLLLDARPGFFYSLGHIPTATSLPKDGCEARIVKREAEIKSAIAAKQTIVIYCTNLLCPDARAVATHLADHGYSSAVLSGGWETWKESGMPTE